MTYNRRVVATIQSHKPIPERQPDGLRSTFNCQLPGQVVSLRVAPDISHPSVGDLQVNLISPAGTVVGLHHRNGNAEAHLPLAFEGGVLDAFLGQEAAGMWTLQVIDSSLRDQGTLHTWKIEIGMRRKVEALACYKKRVNQLIPDNDPNGILSRITVPPSAPDVVLKARQLRVHLNIEHAEIDELVVTLKAPSGRELTLHKRSGWRKQNLLRTISGADLPELAGEVLHGDWDLRVVDTTQRDIGRLVGWAIEFTNEPDLAVNGVLDEAAARSLANAGIQTQAELAGALPLEVSSILAMRRHADPHGVAKRLAASAKA